MENAQKIPDNNLKAVRRADFAIWGVQVGANRPNSKTIHSLIRRFGILTTQNPRSV